MKKLLLTGTLILLASFARADWQQYATPQWVFDQQMDDYMQDQYDNQLEQQIYDQQQLIQQLYDELNGR